ncbi:Verru_Chthon cassette protein A [Prosthecobacter vanneervenii]|uniref:Uncharacterized protein (TIGR02600 family) n=1 Tax=Prosthecobacter vanneervenii TaxID=48466 RepID=A0A7W8DJ25_9BACT|nr:Verru_Chthon cassette protein A [Prosthecobacter vanneervenii]MBB5031401.1 uncharacterized protein (TIGR02600 family) [Prosthecobacter vanneervenii]
MKYHAVSFSKSRQGMALVVVVLMLALMLTFMVAVFSVSDAELKGASRYASGQQARQLGDLAVDVAISQLRKGTTPATGTQGREVWTSQPGMIRQYQASGDLLAAYKLYSSSQMVVPGGKDVEKKLISDAPPANWLDLKARYVDLNRPVHRVAADGTTSLQFPIIDPRAMTGGTDTVGGFSYTSKLADGTTLSGVQTTGGDSQRLPMPVEWLYMLQDGTLGTLDADNKFVGPVPATAANPIVGRIAFWGDDESTKVNINTASEPTAWAVPTFFHEEDAGYARYQPANGELQRYPGHPATTALSPILFPGKTLTKEDKDIIYGLTPKIGVGGSNSATVPYSDSNMAQVQLAQYRKERLYDNLDEYLFQQDRTFNKYWQDSVGNDSSSNISLQRANSMLQRKGFFLTAHSRAPELNLHGLPKIALWPIHYKSVLQSGADYSYSTAYDQLVAFCSTLRQQGGKSGGLRRYIFQRKNADSTQDISGITENKDLLNYLYNLLQNPMPGFAASPAQNYQTKYGDDLRQILVEIFDYVRSTNLYDGNISQSLPGGNVTQNYLLGYATGSTRNFSFKTFTDFRQSGDAAADDPDASPTGTKEMLGNPGHGQVTPSQWNAGSSVFQGIGRIPTITEVGLHFICAADNTDDPDNPYAETFSKTNVPLGKPGGRTALALPAPEGNALQARWFSNFPPVPVPNPFFGEKADTKTWPKTGGFPYGPDANHPGYQPANWNFQLDKSTALLPGFRRIQARVLMEFFVPGAGYTLIEPEITVVVSGLSKFLVNGKQLFPNDSERFYTGRRATNNGSQLTGGYGTGLKGLLRGREAISRPPMPADNNWGNTEWIIKPGTGSDTSTCVLNYNLLSNFLDINVGRGGLVPMDISKADLTIQIYSGHIGRLPVSGDTAATLVQTLKPSFPANTVAAPTLVRQFNKNVAVTADIIDAPAWWTFYSRGALGFSLNKNQVNAIKNDTLNNYYSTLAKVSANPQRGRIFRDNQDVRTGNAKTGFKAARGAFFFGFDAEDSSQRFYAPEKSASLAQAEINEGSDVVQTVLIKHGDYRLTSAMSVVDASQWAPHRFYGQRRLAHSFSSFVSDQLPGYDYGTTSDYSGRLVSGADYPASRIPDLPYTSDASISAQKYGDFDNGPGPARDGPYINKPDEGNRNIIPNNNGVPYFSEAGQQTTLDNTLFSPNRLISSPVMLGSLPTGVISGKPWRTLHFRPQQNHPGGPARLGGIDPPDHLLLEYFWMPVVEPYAISEPFSTAGKINLNYQILPFTNIRRASGLHALFASERIPAVPTSDAASYKVFPKSGDPSTFWSSADGKKWYYKIDPEKTLAQFESRFKTGSAFLSPSEICDIHLVPDQEVSDWTEMETFWSKRRLTGDNTRERPYSRIYPRLTTRSNTYRVHYIAQVIRKARSSPSDVVTPADKFESEHRGSAVVERYLDPAQADLPDFTTATTGSDLSLDNYYQFRVIEKRKFGN